MYRIYTTIFFVSIALTLSAVVVFAVFGLNLGVDFKGGSIMEVEFIDSKPDIGGIQSLLNDSLPSQEFSFSEMGERGLVIRSGELSEEEHRLLISSLKKGHSGKMVEEKSFDSIGPIIGRELKEKSVTGIIVALLVIVVYIAFVFRKMSVVLSSWAMSVAALVALAHDILIPVGVFAILGRFYNIEISAVFVAALLTILGYSVSDTVVVFDRVRENVIRNKSREGFGPVVHKSIIQTLARSLNTTFTTLLSLIAIYIFGGESLKYFTLALILGIFLGAYSSIFVASPLLVYLSGWSWTRKKR